MLNWLHSYQKIKLFLKHTTNLQFSTVDCNVAMQSEGRGETRCGDFSGSSLTLLCSKFLKHTDQTLFSVIFAFLQACFIPLYPKHK